MDKAKSKIKDLKEYRPPKQTLFNRFLWWCSGADAQILKFATYSDYVKYAGMGGIVLATGILAGLSMGFAMYVVFETNVVAISVGLLWGGIIFNLDRFIVSSTGKGDGEHTISWGEFVHALPRLVMATLIGLTISAPLEMYIFNKEIDKEWHEVQTDKIEKRENEINQKYQNKISAQQSEISALEEEKNRYQQEIDKLQALINEEIKTTCGQRCKSYKKERNRIENKLISVQNEITEHYNKIENLRSERDTLIASTEQHYYNQKRGPLDELSALHHYPGSFWPVWLIRLLFVFVEISPVFFKLMIAYGAYDYLHENLMQVQIAKQGVEFKEGFSKVEDGEFHDKVYMHQAKEIGYREVKRREAERELYTQRLKRDKERASKELDDTNDEGEIEQS